MQRPRGSSTRTERKSDAARMELSQGEEALRNSRGVGETQGGLRRSRRILLSSFRTLIFFFFLLHGKCIFNRGFEQRRNMIRHGKHFSHDELHSLKVSQGKQMGSIRS